MRITHLITGLAQGGAETQLKRLLPVLRESGFEQRIVSLIEPGNVGERIRDLGFFVQGLGLRRGAPDPRGYVRLVRLLRDFKPHVLQTWLYHADLLGLLASRLGGVKRVVWNIRCSDMDFSLYGRSTRITLKLLSMLSACPSAIVANSNSAARVHAGFGYRQSIKVIPNGFDVERFCPDHEAPVRLRAELGLAPSAPLIGHMARFDPMKDHDCLLQAAARVLREIPAAIFVLCGSGVTGSNSQLCEGIERLGIQGRVLLLGRRDDVAKFMPALDVLVSSSAFGEGFPNVLGEAMACGVVCAATDVGDSALVLGETGRIVPPRDPEALASAVLAVLRLSQSARLELGLAARKRIEQRFSIAAVSECYRDLYQGLATRNSAF